VVIEQFLIESANSEYVGIVVKTDPAFLAIHHDFTPFFVLVDTIDRIG
jgi:hypothetical protein